MDKLFLVQLIVSFILGGSIVGLQSYVAEKVPGKISGIVLALPSTIIVNFFFLAKVLDSQEFAQILPLIPAPLGISLIFICAYIYIAKWLNIFLFTKLKQNKLNKILLIALSAIPACLIWFVFSLPFAIYKFNNFNLSLLIFIALAFITQLILNRGANKYKAQESVHYKTSQQLGRALFAGLMVAATVYFGKTMGPLWGGVIAMFPAAFLAAICIMHYYYNHEALFNFFRNVPLGISTLIVYAWVAHYSFPNFGVELGTLICIIISYSYSWFLSSRDIK